jgi:precorrin-3B synthase
MSTALPIAGLRRGACPSLDAPMQTGDGLLARLRIAGGRLTPVALGKLVGIAGSYGNGSIEITARGNLQVRGLRAAGTASFARAIEAVVSIERGLVVETPPLAGIDPHERADPRPVARAIHRGATALPPLGPKVTVVVDGDGQINLAELKADIRIIAAAGDTWTLAAGGHFFGATAQPAQAAMAVLTLLADHGPDARVADLPHIQLLSALGHLCSDAAAPLQPRTSPIGRFDLGKHQAIGLGLPFGASPWENLLDLASLAGHHGTREFRLAPHHALLAIGGAPALLDDLPEGDFIVHPTDTRRRISACIGSDGCASGHIAARQVANRLAALMDNPGDLHVAGCAKGCAHPRPADITLVGRPDGYGLVFGGTAGDTPVTVLRADQIATAFGPAAQG